MIIDELLADAKNHFDRYGDYDTDMASGTIRNATSDRVSICMPESSMAHLVFHGQIPDDLEIAAIFDLGPALGDCYDGDVSVFVLEHEKPELITVGVFENKPNVKYAVVTLDDEDPECEMVDPYKETVEQYLASGSVECIWLPTVEDQINEIEHSGFTPSQPYSYCYSKQFAEATERVSEGDTKTLGEIADVLQPTVIANGKRDLVAKRLSGYPFEVTLDALEPATDVAIELNDIIVTPEKALLVDVEPNPSRYASAGHLVLRNPSISPEYLLLFLESRTGKALRRAHLADLDPSSLLADAYSGVPVIMPNLTEEDVHSVFSYAHYVIDTAEQFDYSVISNADDTAADGRELLSNELRAGAKTCHDQKVGEMVEGDINELEKCFECGAYKATLIMAGSVLEAFLIDWLGELNGVNYFNTDYMVQDRRFPNRRKRADLIDYIDAIEEIKRPEWMEEAEKAHKIRKDRNMVHAKLCLNSNRGIDEETCREVIGYLKEIIKTRAMRNRL